METAKKLESIIGKKLDLEWVYSTNQDYIECRLYIVINEENVAYIAGSAIFENDIFNLIECYTVENSSFYGLDNVNTDEVFKLLYDHFLQYVDDQEKPSNEKQFLNEKIF